MPEKQKQTAFEKSQLLKCREFKKMEISPDIISALLKDDKTYTMSEAKDIVNKYMKRKVGY